MRNLLILLVGVLTLSSCSEYQKVFKGEDTAAKLDVANRMYDAGKYTKALRLYEQVIPKYRGKPEAEELQWRYANAYYELGDYLLSAYQLERYATSFPNGEHVETARFRAAKSHYEESPVYSLDQTETTKSIGQLQNFIDMYPESQYMDEANLLMGELRGKLERKAYEIAKNYHHREKYPVAIAALKQFLLDFPGSEYRDDAAFYQAESAYLYARKSVLDKQEERYVDAKNRFKSFQRKYTESEYTAQADKYITDINNRLDAVAGAK